jgi:hypothetical protein
MGSMAFDHDQRIEDVRGSSGEFNVSFGREDPEKPLGYDGMIVDDCNTNRRLMADARIRDDEHDSTWGT